MKKIISVKFEDGTEKYVDDDDLGRYLAQRRLDGIADALRIPAFDLSTLLKALEQMHAEEISEVNAKNSSGSRRPGVTSETVDEFYETFKCRYGHTRGAQKAAAAEFGVSVRTIANTRSQKRK